MIIFDGRTGAPQVRCLAGCDQRDLIDALKARGLWEGRQSADAESRRQSSLANVSHETDALRSRDRARRIFDDAILCHGTLAQRYLEGREIWSVAREIEDVRFHPACPREKGAQPALVIAMRSCTWARSLQAVQRIFLTLDGQKDGAMMLGPVGGAAMQLGQLTNFDRELHVAEGFETALSIMAMDWGPVWALGSCGAMQRLAVVDGINFLMIWADNDRPGVEAANVCAARWGEADRGVKIMTPNREGADFADVWRARNARQ